MVDWTEIIVRLGMATLAGGAIGLNRELNDKPIGVRTLGLVGLATALVVMVVALDDAAAHVSDATSRVIQGLLTGIGFLGAGVIVHGRRHGNVHGLTSAACVWFTASVGVVCGLGKWQPVAVALVIAIVLLISGGPLEKLLNKMSGSDKRRKQTDENRSDENQATPSASDDKPE